MKLRKLLLSVALLATSTLSFAGITQSNLFDVQSSSLNGAYQCGDAFKGGHDHWCDCFHNYAIAKCKASGGGSMCNDKSLERLVKQFGGPGNVCHMDSSHDMSYNQCVSTLKNYIAHCPVR